MFPLKASDIQRSHLPNGLMVMCLEYHKLPIAQIILMMKRGSEHDPSGMEGLADLTAEMVTLGTETRDGERISLEMERLGAQYSASARWDASFLDVAGFSDDFTTMIDLVGDMLQRPTFPREEMRQSQQRRISGLIQQRDQAEVIADEIIVARLMANTPYAHPAYGTIPSLQTMEEDAPRSFCHRHYSPHNAVLLVVGDLTLDQVWRGAETYLGGWKAPVSDDTPPLSPAKTTGRRIIVIDRPALTQSQIRLGLVGISRQDEAYFPFKVMNYIFGGGGFSSRLMQRIRAERGYTYGINSSFKAGRIAGPFIISTFTPTATTVPTIEEILKVMEGFSQAGADAQELEAAKRYFVGSFPLRLETPGQIARQILELELYGIPLDYFSSYEETIQRVTLDEVKGLASAYFRAEDLAIVVVGRADDFLQALRTWGEVELIAYDEVLGDRPLSNTLIHVSTTSGS